jgi:hypothetical protein
MLLNEMPINGKDLYNLNSRKKYLEETLILLNDLKTKELIKKFNTDFMYFLTNDFFVLLKDEKIQAFIRYHKIGESFYVDVIENITRVPNVSLKIYSFILNKLKFKEIITGDILSDKNINAHKRFLMNSPAFSIYIRDKNGERQIRSDAEITSEMMYGGRKESVFVIRENLSLIAKMYNTTEEAVLEEYLGEYLENFTKYIKKLRS